ncbi:translation initiation factor IF-2 [Rickettsiales endosymbiont of Peranema trichophorum]|uniref:translation initiation factor IF-2 n=1 Tax=Rickettsiales endosymbiont of Peranema trichophorum TaxID=2486577 RepID=UPI0010230FC9|nr:translation initiation factor IF-2 [Rickettsiales endosymbiont of Peranema trichophorum]RZI47423.1 translation initiation factor IF-2 [Rickettsiales endosymbiont of Peranema trichophorum]
MTDNSDVKDIPRGKLSIKSGTLGLAFKEQKDQQVASHQNPTTSVSRYVSPARKGTVVVVTKTRGSETKGNQHTLDGSNLSLEEQQRIVSVLKQAELAKKQETNKALHSPFNGGPRGAQGKTLTGHSGTDGSDDNIDALGDVEHDGNLKGAPSINSSVTSQELASQHEIGGNVSTNADTSLTSSTKQAVKLSPNSSKEATTEEIKRIIEKKKSGGSLSDDEQEKHQAHRKAENEKRVSRKISLAQVTTIDTEDINFRRVRAFPVTKKPRKEIHQEQLKEKVAKEVMLPEFITVKELANRMAEKSADVVKALMQLGMLLTLNETIDSDTAELIINEFGHKAKRVTDVEVEKSLINDTEDLPSSLQTRPPVVTIMGHVDHGKTSLLDALRSTDIAGQEAGGITQHIGAYQVKLSQDRYITFLDTPGHQAFTAMRARGSKVTDIVVLVVAADDGVKEQTIEAINHAKAANVPIIIAINKIDKPQGDVTKIKTELLSYDIVADDMGGDNITIGVSATQRINLDKLEEIILLQADMLGLTANPERSAKGTVIEAKMDKGRGPVATLLIQNGTLKTGDIVVAGTSYGKVKAIFNDKGVKIQSALPSQPVEVLGLNQAPTAGDQFTVASGEKNAKDIVDLRLNSNKEKLVLSSKRLSTEQLFTKALDQDIKELNVILKCDVQGSAEALRHSLLKLGQDKISIRIVHSGVGGITESDVTLADTCNALVIGFNVRANPSAKELANTLGVSIKYYSIIYSLIEDVEAALKGMVPKVAKETILGSAEVKQIFEFSKVGKIAGCQVTEGIITRNSSIRVIRDGIVLFDGKIKALKRFKDDVKEVKTGFECGISLNGYDHIMLGDTLEAYETTLV